MSHNPVPSPTHDPPYLHTRSRAADTTEGIMDPGAQLQADINTLGEKISAIQVDDKLPEFCESRCDPHVWLGRFESLATSKRWIHNKHEMLPIYLGDDEHEWFRDLPDATKQQYELLKAAFITEFSPSNASKFEAETKLRSQKQTLDMPVKTFIKHVQREARRIGLDEACGVSIIMNNLVPAARCTITTTPTTYAQLSQTPVARGDIPINDDRYQQLLDLLVRKEAQIASLQQSGNNTTGHTRTDRQHYSQGSRHHLQGQQRSPRGPPTRQQQGGDRQCRGCGGKCQTRSLCPAWGAQCRYCGFSNHFAKCCNRNPQAIIRLK